jgi:hypothetical protein
MEEWRVNRSDNDTYEVGFHSSMKSMVTNYAVTNPDKDLRSFYIFVLSPRPRYTIAEQKILFFAGMMK